MTDTHTVENQPPPLAGANLYSIDRPLIEHAAWVRRGEIERVLPRLLALATDVPLPPADADADAGTPIPDPGTPPPEAGLPDTTDAAPAEPDLAHDVAPDLVAAPPLCPADPDLILCVPFDNGEAKDESPHHLGIQASGVPVNACISIPAASAHAAIA